MVQPHVYIRQRREQITFFTVIGNVDCADTHHSNS